MVFHQNPRLSFDCDGAGVVHLASIPHGPQAKCLGTVSIISMGTYMVESSGMGKDLCLEAWSQCISVGWPEPVRRKFLGSMLHPDNSNVETYNNNNSRVNDYSVALI